MRNEKCLRENHLTSTDNRNTATQSSVKSKITQNPSLIDFIAISLTSLLVAYARNIKILHNVESSRRSRDTEFSTVVGEWTMKTKTNNEIHHRTFTFSQIFIPFHNTTIELKWLRHSTGVIVIAVIISLLFLAFSRLHSNPSAHIF